MYGMEEDECKTTANDYIDLDDHIPKLSIPVKDEEFLLGSYATSMWNEDLSNL